MTEFFIKDALKIKEIIQNGNPEEMFQLHQIENDPETDEKIRQLIAVIRDFFQNPLINLIDMDT